MKNYKCILGGILAMSLAVGTAACGNGENTSANNKETLAETADMAENKNEGTESLTEISDIMDMDDVTEIVFAFAGTSFVPKDLELVEEKINKISAAKAGVTIDIQCFTIGDFSQQINLMITSGEPVDLMCTTPMGSTMFATMTSQKQFQPLNALLDEYAPDIRGIVGETLLAATTFEGEILGVPAYANKAKDSYYFIRTDIVEKYGLEEKVQNIQSLSDITEILETIQGDESFVAPVGGKQTIFSNTFGYWYDTVEAPLMYDTLGAASVRMAGVLIDEDTSKVVNLYEQEEYKKILEIAREWYEKDLVYKDSATYSESGPALVTNSAVASYFGDSEIGAETKQLLATQHEMTCVKIMDGVIDSANIRQFVWGVPQTSTEPEAAVRFLNLMYTDAEIVNLLTWGIEGVHYEEKSDGTIGFPEGMSSENSGYYLGGLDFMFGNTFLGKVWEGNDPDLREKAKAEMEGQRVSPLAGFSVDLSSLENETTAISNVISEYRYALECGAFDPETDYPAFVEKLNASGAKEYIEEVQRQLDAYLANNP